jgi:WD40 repeat protein
VLNQTVRSSLPKTVLLLISAALMAAGGCKKGDDSGGSSADDGPIKPSLESRFGNLENVGDIPVPTGSPSRGFAVSPDGQTVAVGGTDGSITLLAKGGAKPVVLIGHKESVLELEYTPDGQRLVSAAADNRLVVWDLEKRTPIHDLKAHNGDIKALAISSDGTLAATGSVDDDVRVWRLGEGKRAHHFEGHSSTVYAVTFSPNGQHVFSGARDAQIQRWSIEKGAADAEPLALQNTVIALRWSSDNKTLYAAGLTGELAFIDPQKFEVTKTRRVGTSRITDLAVMPDGTLVTAELNGKLTWWSSDPDVLEPIVAPQVAHTGEILQLRTVGDQLATLGKDKRLGRWNPKGERIGKAVELPAINGRIRALALHSGTGKAALASEGLLFVADTANPGDVKAGPDLGPGGISSMAYTKDGTRLLVGRENGRIVELDPANGYKPVGEPHPVHGGSVRHLKVTPDGSIYSAGDDIAIFRLDPKTFEPELTITDHTSPLRAIAIDPQGKRMASSEEDNITVIRYVESNTIQWTRRGHRITHLDFSPNGTQLAMVERRREILLYDVKDRQELKKLKGSPAQLRAMAFHPSGEVILTLDVLGSLRVWSLADGSMLTTGNAGRGRPTALAVGTKGELVMTGGMDPTGSAKLFKLGPKPVGK